MLEPAGWVGAVVLRSSDYNPDFRDQGIEGSAQREMLNLHFALVMRYNYHQWRLMHPA
jgi:hypothetical protein